MKFLATISCILQSLQHVARNINKNQQLHHARPCQFDLTSIIEAEFETKRGTKICKWSMFRWRFRWTNKLKIKFQNTVPSNFTKRYNTITRQDFAARKDKWSHFDLKSWVTGRNKIRPGIPSNWRILESIDSILRVIQNWLAISSQFDSNPGSNFSSASDSTF